MQTSHYIYSRLFLFVAERIFAFRFTRLLNYVFFKSRCVDIQVLVSPSFYVNIETYVSNKDRFSGLNGVCGIDIACA